jgi:hypothetical protein
MCAVADHPSSPCRHLFHKRALLIWRFRLVSSLFFCVCHAAPRFRGCDGRYKHIHCIYLHTQTQAASALLLNRQGSASPPRRRQRHRASALLLNQQGSASPPRRRQRHRASASQPSLPQRAGARLPLLPHQRPPQRQAHTTVAARRTRDNCTSCSTRMTLSTRTRDSSSSFTMRCHRARRPGSSRRRRTRTRACGDK